MSAKKKFKPAPLVECPPEFVRKIEQVGMGMPTYSLERHRPQEAAIALWLHAQGVSNHEICRRLGVERPTLRALFRRHAESLSEQKNKFAIAYAQVATEYTNLLLDKADQLLDDPEQLKNISPDKLAVTVGIMTDKAAQLSGMAGVIVEHRKGPSIDDARQAIEAARARIAAKSQTVDAEIIS